MRRSPDPRPPAPQSALLLHSLGDVASHINASSDLDATLRHLLEAACHETPWRAGGIMTVDEQEGYARVIARHDPFHSRGMQDRWALAESPTRLALAEGRPVVIRDARRSKRYPGYRREALEHGYRTVVVLPMAYKDADGHGTVLSVRAREIVDVGPSESALLRFVVHLGDIAMNKARALADERAFGMRLRGALTAHRLLLDQALSNGSVEAAAAQAMSLLPNPVVVVDLASRQVIGNQSPAPGDIDEATWRAALAGEAGQALLELAYRPLPGGRADTKDLTIVVAGRRITRPALVVPLVIDGVQVGLLIVFSAARDFNDLDHMMIDSARFGLTVQMMRAHLAATAAASSLDGLMSDLIGGDPAVAGDIARRALRLGIDLAAPARMIAIAPGGRGEMKAETIREMGRVIDHEARRVDRTALLAHTADAIVLRAAVTGAKAAEPDRIVQAAERIAASFDAGAIVASSRLCNAPADYADAWRDCDRIISLARRFGRSGIVRAEDFGPLFPLLPAVGAGDIASFVERLLGPVIRHDRAHGTAYVETLKSFLDHGGRVQGCAGALQLHVTTLRYRLGRIQELFAIDMRTPDQRFALQAALKLVDLVEPSGG